MTVIVDYRAGNLTSVKLAFAALGEPVEVTNDPAKVRAALQEPALREGFRERDMVLFTVVAGQGRRNGQALGAARTAALLKALDLDAMGPATFILVGKDGGVKMKEGPEVDLQAVFAEIDRMPMRQRR